MEAVDVVGAGAIGVTVGYALAAAGVTVRFVEASPSKLEAGRRLGVQLYGQPALPAEFIPFEIWKPVQSRLVFLCTKCYDNAEVLSRLTTDTQLVPVQNGRDPLLEKLSHPCAGVAAFVARCEPDKPLARVTRRGPLYVGSRIGPAGTRPARLIAGLLRRSGLLTIRWVKDIRPIQATKLWYNATIAPLATIAGVDNAALLEQAGLRRLFLALLAENYRILRGAGVSLGWLGPLPPAGVAWLLRRPWLIDWLAPRMARSLRGTYCSMIGEMRRGRTELEYYTGQLLRYAHQAGLAAPLNAALYERIQHWTSLRIEAHPALLDELVASLLGAPTTGLSNKRGYDYRVEGGWNNCGPGDLSSPVDSSSSKVA
ncbi:MAG: hypothetical protein NZ703_11085 [Gemmataceae bacterium]|nr:hypothetical protein [Gemmataceae bacterium]